MTDEQRSIEQVKDQLKEIAEQGFLETLLCIQGELSLLSALVGAGIEASTAEVYAACNSIDIYDPSGDKARARKVVNERLAEQLSSIHTTIAVLACTLAAVRNNADYCSRTFGEIHNMSIEQATVNALIHQPECLDDEAAEIAMQQGDSSAMATLRRQLGNLLQEEGQADG
jgi:hypothetical protein